MTDLKNSQSKHNYNGKKQNVNTGKNKNLKTEYTNKLEKEMATHSSVLAWRIPGTGEPGGLPSMGSHSQT